jgi:glyoxylase-like metal-dependent hydrolase (beta-lactamase superfamily II)
MWHTPGHSPDSIVAYAKEDKILFAADTVMPIPFFGDGSWSNFVTSLEGLKGRTYETIVQGHGEVVLRGESHEKIDEDLAYLHTLHNRVSEVINEGGSVEQALEYAEIEECGKSRIILNGIAQQLHESNVRTLYQQLEEETQPA